MSNAQFPALPGQSIMVERDWESNVIIQTSASYQEVRIVQNSNQRFTWTLRWNYLRNYNSLSEWTTAAGFFGARYGSYDSFLFKDPDDYYVIAQPIATGDGTTTSFQLIRTYGTSVQQIFEPNASYTPGGAYQVYLNAVLQSSANYSISSGPNGGVLTFGAGHIPGAGVAITASFGYDWRVRFADPKMKFTKFMSQLASADGVALIGCRQ
jgi:uncharacterized protein (TIGR02217 family)